MSWPGPIARHESAHAIIALALGLEVSRVSIEKSRGKLGYCNVRKPASMSEEEDDPRTHHDDVALMKVAIAGMIINTQHLDHVTDDDGDLLQLVSRLERLELMDPDAYLARLAEQTRRLVEHYRPAIDALAIELEWRKTVSGARVRQIMAEHPPTLRSRSARAEAILKRRPPNWAAIFAEMGTKVTGHHMRPVRFIGEVEGRWWFEKLGL